jgi:ABC-type lipoprotein release transport system permease subunit
MMPMGNLVRMVARNTVRSPKHFVLSAFGIVIGIASFVFFLGLSLGVRNVILCKIFPLEVVEVISPRNSFGGIDMTIPLDDAAVARLRAHPDVADAVPRMALAFPAMGAGTFEGEPLLFEAGGFADGIDPGYLADDEDLAAKFQDWETLDTAPKARCIPDTSIPLMGKILSNTCPNTELYYCDATERLCHRRVPVIISPTTVELYNSQIATAHKLKQINDVELFFAERSMERLRFEIRLGESRITSAGSGDACETDGDCPRGQICDDEECGIPKRAVEGVLIGVSPKAMPIGMTLPIQYVRRWNQEFSGDAAASTYSSIIVTLEDKDQVAPFAAWLEENDLRMEDSMGERFATAIFVVTTLFILISFTIVTISSINIAHNFFMQVSERRREIGVLRAVGASKADVRVIILGEAALIGVIGGILGIGLAYLGAAFVDWASTAYLPRFPFKPETYFDFQPWILGAGLVFSTVFCVLGGFLPARKAARLAPAQALAQQ